MRKVFLSLFFLISISASLFCGEAYDMRELGIIARIISNILAKDSFERKQIDDKVSSMLFDEYFKTLDPGKIYFSQADIASFEDQRQKLDEQIKSGDVSFAYKVYDCLLNKVELFNSSSQKVIAEGFDFNLDEEFEPDRTKMPWAKDDVELRKLWSLKVKYDVLYYRLENRRAAEDLKKESKDKPDEKKKTWAELPPVERTLKRQKNYLTTLKENSALDILGLYLSSLSNIYDPHSTYMPPKSEEDFNINMSLSLVGIGATLSAVDGYTTVESLVPGGPAELEGSLEPEDRIIAVAQGDEEPVDVIDMPLSKVVRLIRGKENTLVRLTVLKSYKGMGSVPEIISIVRDKVKLKDQEASLEIREIPGKNGSKQSVGVIYLPSFYYDFEAYLRGEKNVKSSTDDVKRLVNECKAKNVAGIVFDMRSDGGGSLPEAVSTSGLFIKSGPVVQVKNFTGGIDVKVDPDKESVYDGPLVILVNRLSASATEICAAAMQDYGRAVIIGDKHTHGKGTVQTIIDLNEKTAYYGLSIKPGAMKVTTQKFYRINGESTQIKGVTPDIVFPSFTDTMDIGEQYLDHALPWDKIPSLRYSANRSLQALIPELRKRSEERRKSNSEFQLLEKNIAKFDESKNRKTVSLNEEKRWKEYLKDKELLDQQDALIKMDEPEQGKDKDRKKKNKRDIYLEESALILGDLSEMLAGSALPAAVNQ